MSQSLSSNPKVSVIVPVYNQQKFIGRCIRSLLSQTMSISDFELIIVDDASTDLTAYALTQFIDPIHSNIKVITHAKNLGLPSALNNGINISNADFLIRVDSDDFVNKNFLDILYYYLTTNPLADAVACDYYLVDDNEGIIRRCSSSEEPIACGIMFRKDKLIDIGLYDESFIRHEDKDMHIRFNREHNTDYLALPLYRYRRHSSNITNDKSLMDKHLDRLNKKHGKLANE